MLVIFYYTALVEMFSTYIYAQQGKYFQGNMDTISHITQHIETGKIIE